MGSRMLWEMTKSGIPKLRFGPWSWHWLLVWFGASHRTLTNSPSLGFLLCDRVISTSPGFQRMECSMETCSDVSCFHAHKLNDEAAYCLDFLVNINIFVNIYRMFTTHWSLYWVIGKQYLICLTLHYHPSHLSLLEPVPLCWTLINCIPIHLLVQPETLMARDSFPSLITFKGFQSWLSNFLFFFPKHRFLYRSLDGFLFWQTFKSELTCSDTWSITIWF